MEQEHDAPDGWYETARDDDPDTWPEEVRGAVEYVKEPCWVAHDQPERPLAYGAWLCDCDRCALALSVAAVHEPRLPIVLKTGADRVVVTAEYADEVWSAMGGLEPLCYVRRDYIREVFVGDGLWWWRSDRWWSLSRSERTKHKHAGLRHATRSPSLMAGWGPEVDNPRVPRDLARRSARTGIHQIR